MSGARWSVPAKRIPSRASGESADGFLLRLVAWLRREGIPDRAFIRAWAHGGLSGKTIKARKSVYLDIANPWLVADFERQAGAGDIVVFEKDLPCLDEALGGDVGDASVTEFLVKISDGRPEHG
jgi:hypothetical protein